MKPQKIGRVLGIGLRVAGRVAGERLENAANAPAPQQPAGPQPAAVAQPSTAVPIVRVAGRQSGRVARGIGGFLRPFTRVGGIVLLEVFGVLFLIFVLIFGQMAWRTRASFQAGPDHAKFLAAAALTIVFLYLSISSFWRAGRK